MTGVPVDEQGIVVDALPDDARLVYVTPSHQYPLGSPMSLPRRAALLAWAEQHNAAIVEDDYDSEFRYDGRPIEPLQTLDTTGRVIYVGSFSKTMLPSLRLGFVVAPLALSDARASEVRGGLVHARCRPNRRWRGSWTKAGFARHIRRMRAVYRVRHDLIVAAVAEQFAEHLTVIPSRVGLHISASAADASSATVDLAVERALTAGVAVHGSSVFQFEQPSPPGITIGYGAIQADAIDEGLRRLRSAFDDALGAAPARLRRR